MARTCDDGDRDSEVRVCGEVLASSRFSNRCLRLQSSTIFDGIARRALCWPCGRLAAGRAVRAGSRVLWTSRSATSYTVRGVGRLSIGWAPHGSRIGRSLGDRHDGLELVMFAAAGFWTPEATARSTGAQRNGRFGPQAATALKAERMVKRVVSYPRVWFIGIAKA